MKKNPRWDRFSKWTRWEEELLKWKKWFNGRKKLSEIRKDGNRYALFVYQEWVDD